MLYAALLVGAGIALLPTFVAGDLAPGRLVSLMSDYRPVEMISATYPPGNCAGIRASAAFRRI